MGCDDSMARTVMDWIMVVSAGGVVLGATLLLIMLGVLVYRDLRDN